MKKALFSIGILSLFVISSCCKLDVKPTCDKGDKELLSKYVYEPIIYSNDCNCIVSGKVKYLENGKTAALVDYGNGACDNIATKTNCKDGKCEGGVQTDFTFECTTEKVEEGTVSKEEKEKLGL